MNIQLWPEFSENYRPFRPESRLVIGLSGLLFCSESAISNSYRPMADGRRQSETLYTMYYQPFQPLHTKVYDEANCIYRTRSPHYTVGEQITNPLLNEVVNTKRSNITGLCLLYLGSVEESFIYRFIQINAK